MIKVTPSCQSIADKLQPDELLFVILTMSKKRTQSIIGYLRRSNWSRFCLFLLSANFINLSANFYEGNIDSSNGIEIVDPIDTLSELIFEWALDGNEDVIPDNGTEQDDNSFKKIKLALVEISSIFVSIQPVIEQENDFSKSETLVSGHFSSDSPPPDRS